MMSHPFGRGVIASPTGVINNQGDELDFKVEQYISNSDCNTEYTVIKNGKVVSSDKLEKAKFREQAISFQLFWSDFKQIFSH